MANVDTEVTQIIVNRLTKTQLENAGTLPADELYCVDPEFTGDKILTTSSDGSEIIETSLSADNLVTDVQINGTSVVANGVGNIPLATNDAVGVSKANQAFGTYMSNTTMCVWKAADSDITSKTQNYKPIVPANLEKAIMEGLGNYSGTAWTDAYKTKARNTIGATQAVFVDWSD